MIKELYNLIDELKQISGSWTGKDSGLAEDRAHAADEGIKYAEQLLEVLEELNIK